MTIWEKGVWLITGCSTGLGREIALAVLSRGGRVIATARDLSTLADIVAIGDGCALALPLDVTSPEHIKAAAHQGEQAFGRIDVLVNNAGYGLIGGVEESSDREIRDQFEVNFFGMAAMTRAVLPGMRRRRSGYIINMSSVVGIFGAAGAPWYSASKFALEGLSEALASECRELGIGVMVVEPGPFRTDFNGRSLRIAERFIPDYEPVALARAQSLSSHGTQSGDPARAATAIIAAMQAENPPFRLPLGVIASDMAIAIHAGRGEEAQSVRAIALGADFSEDSVR
ncbi:Short-chain dehydrogenase [Sphingobium faniae]|nr:Short-chain dehydrogenase [Sphingobium faniae]